MVTFYHSIVHHLIIFYHFSSLLYDLLDITYVSHPPPLGNIDIKEKTLLIGFIMWFIEMINHQMIHFILSLHPSILFQTHLIQSPKYDILEVDERLSSHPPSPYLLMIRNANSKSLLVSCQVEIRTYDWWIGWIDWLIWHGERMIYELGWYFILLQFFSNPSNQNPK